MVNDPVAGVLRDGYRRNREDPGIPERRCWKNEQLVLVRGMGVGGRDEFRLDMVGVSVAIYNQPAHVVMIIDPMAYVTVVAVVVWVIRMDYMGRSYSTGFFIVAKRFKPNLW